MMARPVSYSVVSRNCPTPDFCRADSAVADSLNEMFEAAQSIQVAGAETRVIARFRRLSETRKRAAVRDRVFIHSFDWAVLQRARVLDPHLPVSALAVVGETFAPRSKWLGTVQWDDHPDDLAGAAAELGASVVSPDFPSCTAELVEQAHARGMAVLPWTVNDPVIFGDLADLGADGVVTDLPDEMLAL